MNLSGDATDAYIRIGKNNYIYDSRYSIRAFMKSYLWTEHFVVYSSVKFLYGVKLHAAPQTNL
jgi:hypothetical protein